MAWGEWDSSPWNLLAMRSFLFRNILCGLVLCVMSLLWTAPLLCTGLPFTIMVAVHTALVVLVIPKAGDETQNGGPANTMWGRRRLLCTCAGSGGFVCLFVAAVMWLGIRTYVQDVVMQNPFFPVIAGDEWMFPLQLLACYACLFPLMYYVIIARRRCRLSWISGLMLAVIAVLVVSLDIEGRTLADPIWLVSVGVLLFKAPVSIGAVVATYKAERYGEFLGPEHVVKHTRRLESFLIPALAGIALTILVLNSTANSSGELLVGRSLAYSKSVVVFAVGGCILISLVSLLIRYFESTVYTGLLIGLLILGPTLARSHSSAFSVARRSIPRNAGLLRFELSGGLKEADIVINGVDLGTTPLSISATDLLERIPATAEYARDRAGRPTGSFPVDHRFHRLSAPLRTSEYRVSFRNAATRFPGSFRAIESGRNQPAVFVGIRLAKEAGFVAGTSNVSISADGTTDIALHVEFPAWQTRIGRLLDQARLNNYDVSDEWLKAFASFGDRGWSHLGSEVQFEPSLRCIQDALTRHVYGISENMPAEEAWSAFQKLIRGAEESGSYQVSSCRGRALELIVPVLDPAQLVREAHLDLQGSRHVLGMSGYQTWNFAESRWRAPRTQMSLTAEYIRACIRFHAVCTLDRLLDERAPEPDNIVETELTPELLRYLVLESKDGRPGTSRMASTLGGSALDRLLLRRDWRSSVDKLDPSRPFDLPDNSVRFGTLAINRAYFDLLMLNSEAGRKFRADNREEILDLAAESLVDPPELEASGADEISAVLMTMFQSSFSSQVSDSVPPHLKFLFLDPQSVADSNLSMALEFWPRYETAVESTRMIKDHKRLKAKWDYLGRLGDEADVGMFLSAYDGSDGSWPPTVPAVDRMLPRIAPQKKFDVYESVRLKLLSRLENELKGESPDERLTTGLKSQARSLTLDQIRLLCRPGAEALLRFYDESADREKLLEMLERPEFGSRNDSLVRAVSEHSDPLVRKRAVQFILRHPTPQRVDVLTSLLEDSDPDVQMTAAVVRASLDELLAEKPQKCEMSFRLE